MICADEEISIQARCRLGAAWVGDTETLVFMGVFVVISTLTFAAGVRRLQVLSRRRVRLAVEAALVGAAAVCFLLVGLSRLATCYAVRGRLHLAGTATGGPAGRLRLRQVRVGVADAIPLLDVPRTLGWRDPLPRPHATLGWAPMAFRLLLIALIFRFRVVVWRHLSITSRATDTPA